MMPDGVLQGRAMHYEVWAKITSVEQTRGQRQTGRNDLPGMGERVA